MNQPPFTLSATLYDAVYQEKNYSAECASVLNGIKKATTEKINSILDLGCGSGSHALAFSKLGVEVLGIDLSSEMISVARDKVAVADLPVAPSFEVADMRSFRTDRKYGAVVSMFSAINYLSSLDDLAKVFETARYHLESGGTFFLDTWNSAAVKDCAPKSGSRVFNLEGRTFRREQRVVQYPSLNRINITFNFFEITQDAEYFLTEEEHIVTYFSVDQIEGLASQSGFRLAFQSSGFNFDTAPHEAELGLCCLLVKI